MTKKTVVEKQIKTFFKFINHQNGNHKFQCFKKDGSATKQIDVKQPDKLVKLCKKHHLQGLNCLSVNPRKKDETKTGSVTDITNILIDVDVKKNRKKDGVSTKKDKQKTKKTAEKIIKELEEKINLRVSLFVDSGNGFHIYIPVFISLKDFFKEESKQENKQKWDNSKLKCKLVSLEQKLNKFNNQICEIDCVSKDIVRRVKIPGTWNVKPEIEEKNYRQAEIIQAKEGNLKKAVVQGNTKVLKNFEPVKPVEETTIEQGDINLETDENKELREILEESQKARDLFNGKWQMDKYDYPSRSEAEIALADRKSVV